ncbi:hypothetical protein GWK47_014456 [Chionoecetes opilio]|uniref:Uncharacterized protein n=1 Tax=Chionoecetes opilio TaxID=41210 RepID=A0A8J5CL09_CHIOP|nr:hypothetical protein GWK47_014456 [Chionoecetes opilio]
MHVASQLQQLKCAGENGPERTLRSPDNTESWRQEESGGLVRCATDYHPLSPPQQQPRADGALLQRVRLGYCTREELQGGLPRGKLVRPCEMAHPSPLVHYLIVPRHRPPGGPARPPPPSLAGGGLLSGSERQGRPHVPTNLERRDVGVLRATPPRLAAHHPHPAG